jgi:hypothetical protein
MRHKHCLTCNIARNTEKVGKWEMHTLGSVIWWENFKSWKMRNTHCRTWNMSRYTEKCENEKYTMYDLDYSEKKKVKNERQTL